MSKVTMHDTTSSEPTAIIQDDGGGRYLEISAWHRSEEEGGKVFLGINSREETLSNIIVDLDDLKAALRSLPLLAEDYRELPTNLHPNPGFKPTITFDPKVRESLESNLNLGFVPTPTISPMPRVSESRDPVSLEIADLLRESNRLGAAMLVALGEIMIKKED